MPPWQATFKVDLLNAFQYSFYYPQAHQDYLGFIHTLSESVRRKKISEHGTPSEVGVHMTENNDSQSVQNQDPRFAIQNEYNVHTTIFLTICCATFPDVTL